MHISDYLPNSLFKYVRWEIPKYFNKQNDDTEISIFLQSPFSSRYHANWHQKLDTSHPHTYKYRLLKSICDNDLEELKILLDIKPDLINSTFHDGFTPLSLASSLNRVGLLDYLILRGANLEELDNQGRTPLIQAVINWQIESIKILTERGANVHTKGSYGYDALDLGIKFKPQIAKIRKYEQIAIFLELQSKKQIKPHIPPHSIEFNFEDQLAFIKRIMTKPKIPEYEPKQFPFNDYKGLYQINLLQ